MERLTWWGRLRAIDTRSQDGALAVLFMLLSVGGAVFGRIEGTRETDAFTFVLIVLGCVPLTFRRRMPLPVLAVVSVAATVYAALGYPDNLVLPLLLGTYTVGAHEPRDRALLAGGPIAAVGGLATQLSVPGEVNWLEALIGLVFAVAIPMAIGRAIYNRRLRLGEERERAAHDAVVEERARIARELHDIVAHAMSVMVVQAGAARTVVARDPAQATEALRRIEATGRTGLGEMRRLIGILTIDGGAESVELAPQPGLGDLDRLLDTVRSTALPVERVIEGTPRALPPGVDLTAYRVVQEGLTNVLKHAGRASARVTIRYGDDALTIEVADDGRGPTNTTGEGHGLIGMRERVALFGGTLETGARAGGGFELRARVPVAEIEPATRETVT